MVKAKVLYITLVVISLVVQGFTFAQTDADAQPPIELNHTAWDSNVLYWFDREAEKQAKLFPPMPKGLVSWVNAPSQNSPVHLVQSLINLNLS